MRKLRLLAMATALAVSVGVVGSRAWTATPGPADAPPVLLRTGTVYPGSISAASAVEVPPGGQRGLYVVQFRGPVTEALKASLRRLGAELGDYIPEYAFLVRMDAAQARAASALPAVRGVRRYLAGQKVDPALRGAGQVTVRAVTFSGGLRQVLESAQEVGAELQELDGRVLVARMDQAKVQQFAASEDVVWVEPVRENKLFNDKAAGVLKVPGTAWEAGLKGEGQVVGVADTGLDSGVTSSMHADLKDRVQTIYSLGRRNDASDTHGHGTHVAGSIVGTGAAGGAKVKGMAPGAKLVFQSVGDARGGLGGIPDDLGTLFGQAYQAGARIHTDSWGVPYSGGGYAYDTQAQAVDRFVWEQGDMTILFAAGNDGDHDQDGKVNYGTVSTPGTAKNALTVGASENDRPDRGKHADNPDTVAIFSSRGPAPDGRVKPDVVAPGSWILSTRSSKAPDSAFWANYDSNYAFMGGTSMATPITAGTVALVRQHLANRLGGTPRASLVKAAVINGAVPITGTWQDYGWGRVDMANSLGTGYQVANEERALKTGESQAHAYSVKAGSPLKVTLVWTDYPANPAAQKSLVNDLDLEVKGPDGKTLVGNAGLLGQSGPDRVNNVENVVVASPAAGTYTVTVKAHNVPQGPQPYSIVASGNVGGGDAPNPPPNPPDDRTPPEVRLTAPAEGATLSGSATLKAEASDAGGVDRVEFLVDGTPVGQATGAPYQVSWDTTAVADGAHKVSARAYDKAGNSAESSLVSVTVRNGSQPPPPAPGNGLTQTFNGEVVGWNIPRRLYFDVGGAGDIAATMTTTGTADVDVAIYDPSGNPVWSARKHGARKVKVAESQAGTYSAVVYAFSGRGTWTLTVSHPAATSKQGAATGTVDAQGTRTDRFSVRMVRRGALNLHLSWDRPADLDLYLVNAQGRILARSTGDALNPETLSALVPAGTYTVYVIADRGKAGYAITATYPK